MTILALALWIKIVGTLCLAVAGFGFTVGAAIFGEGSDVNTGTESRSWITPAVIFSVAIVLLWTLLR